MPLTTESGVPPAARTMSSARAVNILLFSSALVFGTGFYFRFLSTRPGTVDKAPLSGRDYQTNGAVPGVLCVYVGCIFGDGRMVITQQGPHIVITDEAVEQGDPRLQNVQQAGRRDKAVEALMEPAVVVKKK